MKEKIAVVIEVENNAIGQLLVEFLRDRYTGVTVVSPKRQSTSPKEAS